MPRISIIEIQSSCSRRTTTTTTKTNNNNNNNNLGFELIIAQTEPVHMELVVGSSRSWFQEFSITLK